MSDTTLEQFCSENCTLSYILSGNGKAAIIDPVLDEGIEKYLDYLHKNNLALEYIIDTHTHADHISASSAIKLETGAKIVMHSQSPSERMDIVINQDDILLLGDIELKFFNTPGHTNDSICIFVEGIVFTGDTMLIGGCGRTDFQNGSAQDLYESIFNKLLTLPDLTKVYPGHDYKERFCSTIKEERENSPRLQLSKEDFIQTLDNHHPGLPEKFKESVQENSK